MSVDSSPPAAFLAIGSDQTSPGAYFAWRDARPWDDPGVPVSDGEVFVQMYTSGTTGMGTRHIVVQEADLCFRF